MQPNWYNGTHKIHQLEITSNHLTIIEANALNWFAFNDLEKLTIIAIAPIDYQNATIGLERLDFLRIEDINSGIKINNIFIPLRKTITSFYYGCAFGETDFHNLNDLFGKVKLSKLEIIHFVYFQRSDNANGVILASNNFTGLAVVQEMHLVRCGIIGIMDGTFDFIGETLLNIDLTGNQLFTVTMDLFRVFLDEFSNMQYPVKCLTLLGNPLICNHEFYKLRNVTVITFGYLSGNYGSIRCENIAIGDNNEFNISNNLQTLHTKRWHLNHAEIEVYAYPKFQLKFDKKKITLIVKQLHKSRYRLLVQNYSKTDIESLRKCPNKWMISKSISCLLLKNMTEIIAIQNYMNNFDPIMFCIIYISFNRKTWPLHCTTIHTLFRDPSTNFSWIWSQLPFTILLWFAISITGLFLGLISIAFLFGKQPKEPAPAPV